MGAPSAPLLGFFTVSCFLFFAILINVPHRIGNHDAVLSQIISHHEAHMAKQRRESNLMMMRGDLEEEDDGSEGVSWRKWSTAELVEGRTNNNFIASLNLTIPEREEQDVRRDDLSGVMIKEAERSNGKVLDGDEGEEEHSSSNRSAKVVDDKEQNSSSSASPSTFFDPVPTNGLSSFHNLIRFGNTFAGGSDTSRIAPTALYNTSPPLLLQTHQQRINNARKAAHTFFGLGIFFGFWCYFRSRYNTINAEHELIVQKNAEAKKRERARRREEKQKRKNDSNNNNNNSQNGNSKSTNDTQPSEEQQQQTPGDSNRKKDVSNEMTKRKSFGTEEKSQ